MALKNASNASNPPAEAPIPTIGKPGAISVAAAGFAFGVPPADGDLAEARGFLLEARFFGVLATAFLLAGGFWASLVGFFAAAVFFVLRDCFFLAILRFPFSSAPNAVGVETYRNADCTLRSDLASGQA